MNKKVKLLDCTLRDGGFVNDWKFGHGTLNAIFNRLSSAQIDIIELGFIDARRQYDIDRTILPDTSSFKKNFDCIENSKAIKVAMIDYGTCSIENIEERKNSIIDGIRVIFKKKDIDRAIEFCEKLKDKGYLVFVQPVSITTYSDYEMLSLVNKVNVLNPYAFSMVDTYGLMHRKNLFMYFYLIDKNLDKKIRIGFHSHNNFQLAYSNSIELLTVDTDREIILDGTCYGMGKSAGNANSELLAMFLNENCDKTYDISYIMEAIDASILPIYQRHYWGYSLNYFLSASNDCHPNYVKYLIDKNTLSIKSINEILAVIEKSEKLTFNQDYIHGLYIKYQRKNINDSEEIKCFSREIGNRTILLLAPGKSVSLELQKIKGFIKEKNPIVIALNFNCKDIVADYIFVSNSKRYMQLLEQKNSIKDNQKIIVTSNIVENYVKVDYTFNYESLLCNIKEIMDTSVIMILSLLEKCGIKEIFIAGLDGFSKNGENNYSEKDMIFEAKLYSYAEINAAINKALKRIEMRINFITDTIYHI